MKILLVAGFADSLIGFRKPLIRALLNQGLTVHVAAPELTTNNKVTSELHSLGVITHDISMQRTGMNPLSDLSLCYQYGVECAVLNLITFSRLHHQTGHLWQFSCFVGTCAQSFCVNYRIRFCFYWRREGARSKIRVLVQGLYRLHYIMSILFSFKIQMMSGCLNN